MPLEFKKNAEGAEYAVIGQMMYGIFPDRGIYVLRSALWNPAKVDGWKGNEWTGKPFQDVESAKAEIEDIYQSHEEIRAFGRVDEASKTSTPWGRAQDKTFYARGINFYSTPGHGGYKLSASLNAQVHESLRNKDGWYEEDNEYCIVMITFPEFFSQRELRAAEKMFRNVYPDQYEEIRGVTLKPGESYARDEQVFKETHKNDWVVISASGTDRGVECIATLGGVRQGWNMPEIEERTFLVPAGEYQERSVYGFVIDPDRHEELGIDAPAP